MLFDKVLVKNRLVIKPHILIITGMNVLQVQSLLAAATAAANALQNNPGKRTVM